MRVPYSYSARKKISKFLKAHEELDLIPQMQGKCGDKTFEHFMRWYDCETDTCADIKEKCEKDCFIIDMPF